MTTVQQCGHADPLPRYTRPDLAIPEYEEILEQLQQYRESLIGASYYYIRAEQDRPCLCRILPGGGKIYFHEIVDHAKYGITDHELEEAVNGEKGAFAAGYYPVSKSVGTRIRAALDYR